MADKEYIERMQVLHEIGWLVTQKQGTKNGYFPNRETLTPAEVRDIILNAPAADVVEVRRGEWVECRCSVCGMVNPTTYLSPYKFKYECLKTPFCPKCGADMRGKKEV